MTPEPPDSQREALQAGSVGVGGTAPKGQRGQGAGGQGGARAPKGQRRPVRTLGRTGAGSGHRPTPGNSAGDAKPKAVDTQSTVTVDGTQRTSTLVRTPLSVYEAGRLGGLATARRLSPEARRMSARRAVRARWARLRSAGLTGSGGAKR